MRLTVLVLASLILGGAFLFPGLAKRVPTATLDLRLSLDEVLLMATNNARVAEGLVPVVLDPVLKQTASCKLGRMLAGGYWGHSKPGTWDWFDCLWDAGLRWGGENLARCYDGPEIVVAWLESPGHRKNLLKPEWRRVGFAQGQSSVFRCSITVQHFAP